MNAHRLLLAALAIGGLGQAAPARAAAATGLSSVPGRVVFSDGAGPLAGSLDRPEAVRLVATPDGGAILAAGALCTVPVHGSALCPQEPGFRAARLTGRGFLDPSFGGGGVAVVAPDARPLVPRQLLRQPDGKAIVIAAAATTDRTPQTLVVRLNQDGGIDRTFGSGGLTTLPLAASPEGTTAALAPNGTILLTGAVGNPTDPASFRWALGRLTPSGALDPAFGTGGLLPIGPTSGLTYSTGLDVDVRASGEIVTLGRFQPAGVPFTFMTLTRLTPAGAPDPAFNGGGPVLVPAGAAGSAMLLEPDGSVYVDGAAALVRFTAAGALDPKFAGNGVALISIPDHAQFLPTPDGGVLAVAADPDSRSAVVAVRIGPDGARQPVPVGGLQFQPLFGGGRSGPAATAASPALPPLVQYAFSEGEVAQRSDGSLLVAGGVSVAQPTAGAGVASGRSTFDFAVAALTPQFTADERFGAAGASPLRARLSVSPQHPSAARARHAIRVSVNASTPGLAQVTIKAHGQVVAQDLLPIFTAGSHILPVGLTRAGAALLRRAGPVRVTATAQVRDLLARTLTTSASRTIR